MLPHGGSQDGYLASMVLTASPAQRHVLLIEAALRNCSVAREKLLADKANDARTSLLKAQDLIAEMISSLDPTAAPDLVGKLRGLYRFTLGSLARAGDEDRVEPLDEAVKILQMELETWRELRRRVTEVDHANHRSFESVSSEGFQACV